MLYDFLTKVLPAEFPSNSKNGKMSRGDFINDVKGGIHLAPMSTRLTPHILSVIDWTNPMTDPVRRQFIPLRSCSQPDHPRLTLDSLHETEDSPVPGLVYRYPHKALFLGDFNVFIHFVQCQSDFAFYLQLPPSVQCIVASVPARTL